MRHAGLHRHRRHQEAARGALHPSAVEVLRNRRGQSFVCVVSAHLQSICRSRTSISAGIPGCRSASTTSWVCASSGRFPVSLVTCSPAHVVLSGVDAMGQPISDEERRTKDVRIVPYNWAESFRFGSGAMGLEVLAGIRVQIVQGASKVLGEGMLPLDQVFAKLDREGYLRHVVHMRNEAGEQGVGEKRESEA